MNKSPSKLKSYAIYGGVGMSMITEIAVSGVLGYWGGAWADKKLGSQPWLAILGVVLFLAAAFTHIFRSLIMIQKRLEKEDE